jgi:O-antigen ligase
MPGFLPFRTSEELAARFAAILCLSFFVMRSWWLKLFLAWCVVRVIIGLNPPAILTLQIVFLYFMLFQVLADKMNGDRIKVMLNIIGIIGILQSVMVVLQYFGIWYTILPAKNSTPYDKELFSHTLFTLRLYLQHAKELRMQLTGFTSNANMAGGMLALCLPALFRKRWIWFAPLIMFAIFAVGALQGILAALLVTAIYIVAKSPKKWRIPMVIAGVAGITAYLWKSGEYKDFIKPDRWLVWKIWITTICKKRWVIGWGLGQGQYLWKLYAKLSHSHVAYTHPHNEYIHLWTEMGVIGFSLMFGYITTALYKFIRGIDKTKFLVLLGILSGLFNCGVSFPVHITNTGIILLAYFAMMQSANQTEVRK